MNSEPMNYKTFIFKDQIDWSVLPNGKLEFFNWEGENAYRPETEFMLAFCGDSLSVRMLSCENDVRATYTEVNSPCWQDSCMEFFFAPFGKENGYINIEVNPLSAYLAEFGKERCERVLLNSLTDENPVVESSCSDKGWSTMITVPYLLIEDVFKRHFDPLDSDFYADFFKCGDLTDHPHWLSFTPMGENPPGFHDPNCFAKVEIIRYEQ